MAKFCKVAPFTAKVVEANTLIIEPILTLIRKKIVGGLLSPVGCALAKLCHSV